MFPQSVSSARLDLTFKPDVPTFELTSHGRCGVYAVVHEGCYAGAVSVTGISDGHCEIGYEIEPSYQGRGIASEAVSAVADQLDMAVISAQARSDNAASRRVLEKAGFLLASSKLVWPYGCERPLQIMAYRRLKPPTVRHLG